MLAVGGIGLISTIIWILADLSTRGKRERELIQKASKQSARFVNTLSDTPREKAYSTSLERTEKIQTAGLRKEVTEAGSNAGQTSSAPQTEDMAGGGRNGRGEMGETESIMPVTEGMKHRASETAAYQPQSLKAQGGAGTDNGTESIFHEREGRREAKFCTNCGVQIVGNGRFCTKCGYENK